MPRRSSAFVRLLLRAYPRSLRVCERDALEAACIECLARERARLGRLGVLYASGRLIADTISAAILLRVDERRRRRLAWHHSHPSAPKEILMTRIWQDVRYAARLLQRAPLFSLVVIATLALTIGATTAVFTVVNAVLLRALPYHDPTRLVLLQQAIGGMPAGFSPPDYLAFEARAGFFESIAAFRNREYELSGVEPPERVTVTRASASARLDRGGMSQEKPMSNRVVVDGWKRASIPVAVIVALVACALPAWRVTRVDPLKVSHAAVPIPENPALLARSQGVEEAGETRRDQASLRTPITAFTCLVQSLSMRQ
jgi:hypothetical protein